MGTPEPFSFSGICATVNRDLWSLPQLCTLSKKYLLQLLQLLYALHIPYVIIIYYSYCILAVKILPIHKTVTQADCMLEILIMHAAEKIHLMQFPKDILYITKIEKAISGWKAQADSPSSSSVYC